MKRRKTLVRAVALFMVGLITALALTVPTSAIVSQYLYHDNNPSTRCPVPFDVRFWYEHTNDEESLYFGYDIPVGYGSLEQNLISGGLDSAEGKKFNSSTFDIEDESFRGYYDVGAPVYINHMTAWGEIYDYWGYIPVEFNVQGVDRTNFDGIAIDAPTFFYNVWESTYYQDTTEGVKLFSMPTIQLPVLDDGKVYVGRYNVTCGIHDTNGEFRNVEYSVPIDQRENNDPIPFLNADIFDQYLTTTEDGLVDNYIVAVDGFQAYIDVDVYEYVEPEPDITLDGTWVLNDTLNAVSQNYSFDIQGTCNYIKQSGSLVPSTFGYIYLVGNSANGYQIGIAPERNNSDTLNMYYVSSGNIKCYYNKMDSLISPNSTSGTSLRTFTITSTNEEVTNGDALLAWLQANATKQGATASASATTEGTWELVENSPDKCTRLIVTYPIHKVVAPTIGGGITNDIYNRYGYPDWLKYDNSRSHTISSGLDVDFTGWIATATSGFLNFELFPNFSIGGVLAILVGFSLVILFLKIFAGG